MTTNVGTVDRVIRGVLGIILLALPFASGLAIFDTTWVVAVSVIAGLVMLGTAATKFCPIYRAFGFRTCKI